MSEMFNGSIKGPENNEGKSYWHPSGHTLWVDEYEGQPTYQMVDARGDVRVTFFPKREKKADGESW